MPKRRANGEGNIRKRKDGRWEGRYTVGHDPETGKAIIKNVLGKTQAEVKEKLKKAVDATKHGFAYLHVLSACPTGWKAPGDKAIEMSRMATQTNYFPLWEAEYGEFRMTVKTQPRKPITEFTKYMRRFAHLTPEELDFLQKDVDTRYEHVARLCKN